MTKFRNVNVGRGYELEDDKMAGFVDAVRTNRTLLALEYAAALIEELSERVAVLEAPKTTTRTKAAKDEAASA